MTNLERASAGSDRSPQDEPLYNIGVVERMTGIPVATLRVWERRYAFPDAARTEGGHRIYSDREVSRLRWVKARIDEGMQVGNAVRALEMTERAGRFPEPLSAGAQSGGVPATGKGLESVEHRLLESLLAHDGEAADLVLGEALPLYPLEEIVLRAIRPMLARVGEEWQEGRVSVATEHFASQYVRRRLINWMPAGPAPRRVRPVVLACAPDEWHDTSLLMLSLLLRRRRWPAAYLGQAVPLPDLARFVRAIRPSAVVLVAMREENAAQLTAWPQHMAEAARTARPPVTFGGAIFSRDQAWRERVPGRYLGATIEDGLETLETLLTDVTGVA